MLVITGTQRSGTSMIAKCFIELGYDLGSDLWDEEVQGGYENETICAFYRNYTGAYRFPFDDYPFSDRVEQRSDSEHIQAFVNLDLQAVKFSYLLMNPAFVTIWHKFRPDSKDVFLVMSRDKQDVCRSKGRLQSRFGHDSWLLLQSPVGLNDSFGISLGYLQNWYKTEVLSFPWCLDHLKSVNTKLDALGLDVQIPQDGWDKVTDVTKIHF